MGSLQLDSLACLALILAGCAVAEVEREVVGRAAEEVVDEASTALVGQDTFLYLRCNATDWSTDGATRLRGTADPYLFSLLYDVQTGVDHQRR
jgi:hypothetical protein